MSRAQGVVPEPLGRGRRQRRGARLDLRSDGHRALGRRRRLARVRRADRCLPGRRHHGVRVPACRRVARPGRALTTSGVLSRLRGGADADADADAHAHVDAHAHTHADVHAIRRRRRARRLAPRRRTAGRPRARRRLRRRTARATRTRRRMASRRDRSNTTCRLDGTPDQFPTLEAARAFPSLSFDAPVQITHAPDGSDRLFVVEQVGTHPGLPERRSRPRPRRASSTSSRVSTYSGEEGLLGLAFHPDYATNGTSTSTTRPANPRRSVIARYHVSARSRRRRRYERAQVMLEIAQPYDNHNGGQIAFGPDGMLYVSLGDGGSAGDPRKPRAESRRAARQDPSDRRRSHRSPDAPTPIPPTIRSSASRVRAARSGRSGCATRGA